MHKRIAVAALGVCLGFGAGFRRSEAAHAPDPVQNRGCCSHHGGVCGCNDQGTRAKCCDGVLSPTCGC